MTAAFAFSDISGRGHSESEKAADQPSGVPWSSRVQWSGQPRVAVDVLVVDDNENTRKSLAEILGTAGYSVAVAADGESALHLVRQLEVGGVLLDLRIPDMDGVAFLETLDVAPPVIVLSAHSLNEEARARLGFKVVAQLQKPIDPFHLLKVVAETLGH